MQDADKIDEAIRECARQSVASLMFEVAELPQSVRRDELLAKLRAVPDQAAALARERFPQWWARA